MTMSAPTSHSSVLSSASSFELPVHLTRFIGRSHELSELDRLLRAKRLLTLTGAGGSGKTRLARELAGHAPETFTRVAWVDLAPLADGSLVAQEVGASLRIPDRADAVAADVLVAAIGDSHTLLVLDNCEHVVDACAELVERLLSGCPRLSVLATSREALGIPSETAWLVPPLVGVEAMQLFVERAQAAVPSFALLDTNTDAVREICRRLDGIPLAIELAAARVRVLTPEQIAGRLNDAFRLLTTGSRTALARHRTLRGTMDWSYALLNDREQALLRRLAVFFGTFSLEAAEDVCSGAPLETEDILDGVAALVDKSLVVMDAGESQARYRLLETVRQYGIERSAEAGELERTRERHTMHFLAFAESVAPHLYGGEDEPGLIARINLDHDNLRAAAAWASNGESRAVAALRFADALFWYHYGSGYWLGTGQFREARQYIAAALHRAPNADPLLRGRALAAAGLNALAQGDYADARVSFDESLALVRQYGTESLVAFVLSKLGATHIMLGDPVTAGTLLDEAYAIAHPMRPQILQAFVYCWRGWAALVRGDFELARSMFDVARELGRKLSHRTTLGHSASMLGRLDYLEGNHEEAFAQFAEGLRLHLDVGDGWGLALDLEGMACLAVTRRRYMDGVRLMGGVDAMRERIGVALPASDRQERERLVLIAKQELGSEFDRLYEEGRNMSMDVLAPLATDAAGLHTAEYRVPAPDLRDLEAPNDASAAPPSRATMRVHALGPLQVIIGDEPIDATVWGSARPRELLVFLLMHPEGRTKEQVGLAFWPEASAAQLRNSFHVTLHRLRKALRNPEWITLSGDRYRVDHEVVAEFDVAMFERDVAAARRALKRGENGALASLERALTHFRGDFLDGEAAGDWHIEHRDRLQRLYVDSLMTLGDGLAADERHAQAADAYRRVLARDDLHEDAVRSLMRCHAALGERAQALRLYQRFVERLAKELDAEPDEETVELHQSLQRA